ncbi:MAG: hypothetical protein ACOY46_09335 [Bacillota bacterium]
MKEFEVRKIFFISAWSALFSVVAVVIWIVSMIVFQAPEGTPEEQLVFLYNRGLMAGVPFLNAFILSVLQLPVFAGVFILIRPVAPVAALAGSLAGLVYVTYSSLAYWLQYVMVIRFPELYVNAADALLKNSIEQHYFLVGSFMQHTFIYAADQLGYLMLALASLILGKALLYLDRAAGAALIVSGVLGAGGAAGYLTAVPWLEFGNILSGAAYLLYLAFVCRLFWGIRQVN